MSPKRGAYPLEFRRAAVRMLREGRELGELARELGVTTTTLRVWLYVAEGGTHGLDRSRDAVIAGTVHAYERLDGFLRRLPRPALDASMRFSPEAIDRWRVKDAVAHVAHYKARVADRLTRGQPAGGRLSAAERALRKYWDPDSWEELEASDRVLPRLDATTRRRHGGNHLVYVRWCDRGADEIVSWHRMVHRRVVSVLEHGPEIWFVPAGVRASRGGLSNEAVGNLSVHSDQHLRDIRRTLDAST